MRQGYDWVEESLRPIPSLDAANEALSEEAASGTTRVVTAIFSEQDFSPSLFYKAELFRDGSATGKHCYMSVDIRHSPLGYDDESKSANCAVVEEPAIVNGFMFDAIKVSFEGLTQVKGTYKIKLSGCMRDSSNNIQCGQPGSAGTKSVDMKAPS